MTALLAAALFALALAILFHAVTRPAIAPGLLQAIKDTITMSVDARTDALVASIKELPAKLSADDQAKIAELQTALEAANQTIADNASAVEQAVASITPPQVVAGEEPQ